MRSCLAAVLASLLICTCLWAGGGGENMILVVNPGDENALRVANAYAQLRNIPDRNIIFMSPPPLQRVLQNLHQQVAAPKPLHHAPGQHHRTARPDQHRLHQRHRTGHGVHGAGGPWQ